MSSQRAGDVVIDIQGRVARVLIDRAGAHNALSPAVLRGLRTAIDAAAGAGCSVLVLSGAGGSLSAGADLKYLRGLDGDPAAVRDYITAIGETLGQLEAAPFVSVCVVAGYALAGGCEILLACDLPVASEDAAIGDRHLEYGLLPGAGGSVRLTRALAPALARRLLYTGEIISGREAAAAGLVSYAVPAAELDEKVDRLVARLARHAPDALARMKRLRRNAETLPAADALGAERELILRHLATPTAGEGLAAFAEGRAPRFAAEPADDHQRVPAGGAA